jgi:subtilisin family serine protease
LQFVAVLALTTLVALGGGVRERTVTVNAAGNVHPGVAAHGHVPLQYIDVPGKVHPAVLHALDGQETVRVTVALRRPPALAARKLDIPALRAQVASVQQAVLGRLASDEVRVVRRYQAVPALTLEVDRAALARLAADASVVEVVPDVQGTGALNQSRPLINVDEVHTAGVTGAGVTVAVLDSGIDTDHPDLAGDIAFEECFLLTGCPGGGTQQSGPGAAEDDHGHGTNVAGIITGDGTVAPKGVAPDAQIAAYKILDANNSGFFSDWTAALDDIINNHLTGPQPVHAVNMSLQSPFDCSFAGAMATAIETLRSQGVPTFIAAGTHAQKNAFFIPACIEAGISVGAVYDSAFGSFTFPDVCTDSVTAADQVTCFSDSHDTLDVLAPGALISATGRGGGTSTFAGTSQATPHAAGVFALLRQAAGALGVDDVERRLEATGTFVVDDLDDGDPTTNRTTPRIDARVALLQDANDDDQDGCTNLQEFGPDPALGGERNPLHFWDFFDTPDSNGVRDRAIVLTDVLSLLQRFGADDAGGTAPINRLTDPLTLPPPPPAYHPAFDRSSPPPGVDLWHLQPADGAIALNDVLAMLVQFGHSCL